MLDQDFCNFLEHHLTKSLLHSSDSIVKGLWCDGILMPSNQNDISKKSVNDKREIWLKAFFGRDGQDEYLILMKFGRKSLSKYPKGHDIKDCVPNIEDSNWYNIDFKTKNITIQLL